MANTTNLSLEKLDTGEKIKLFPNAFNSDMDDIDSAFGAGFGVSGNPSVNTSINNLADGLAIIANGNTHAAISAGQFVYVRNHASLSEGLYVATASVAANGTLSGSNVTQDTSGGLNTLKDDMGKFLSSGTESSFANAWNSAQTNKITAVHISSGASDAPTNVGEWDCIQGGSGDFGWQMALQSNSNDVYFRRRYTGSFQSWQQISIFDPSYSGTVDLTSYFSSYSYMQYPSCQIVKNGKIVTFSFAAYFNSTHSTASGIEIVNLIPEGYRPTYAGAYGSLNARFFYETVPVYIEQGTGTLHIDNNTLADKWVGVTITYIVA